MGFLGDIFDDVVDIASAPIKVGAVITDKVLYPFEEDGVNVVKPAVDKIVDVMKTK